MIISLEKLRTRAIDPFALLDDDARERLLRAAETDVSILLLGETGTGKGQMARAIAGVSRRKELVEVNCSALPDELLGSELFGHRRGAFTGAVADRDGLLATSKNKTVFLDEIGEVSLTMQRMLLRVVQRSHRTMKPLGADREVKVPPIRFLFATNRDLEAEVRSGRFREDLLRRIDVFSVVIPPLRARPDLIRAYAGRFLEELSELHGLRVKGIESAALESLERRTWPGNVRELKNALERALVTAPRRAEVVIRCDDLPSVAMGRAEARAAEIRPLEEIEEEMIRRTIEWTGGNVKVTMQLLGIQSRSMLYSRMRKYGIESGRIRMQDEEAEEA